MNRTAMSYLQTYGPAGDPATRLQWGLLVISVAVIVIITALVLYGCLRRRASLVADDSVIHPNDRSAVRWIYIGVGITVPLLIVSAIWTFFTLAAVAAPAQARVTIEVRAHQWWWELRYLDNDSPREFTTANEIHIPVGEPVRLRLISDDVIHSFWVPQLAGKTDMFPGQINIAWIQAQKIGEYRGQCGEYCGAQHAHMAMRVIAQSRAQFDAWRDAQLQPSAPPQLSADRHGQELVVIACKKCHTIRDTAAMGRHAPDLTHLMSRSTIAADELRNTKGNLSGWVANPQALKPGARMPPSDLSPRELNDVVSYLMTLR